MKRDKTIGVTLTLDEWKELRKKMRIIEDKDGKTYSLSSYIRSKLILPHINGNSPPSVQDSKQENVSNGLEDTFSENPDSEESDSFEFDLKI
jgi:hypothetical protein